MGSQGGTDRSSRYVSVTMVVIVTVMITGVSVARGQGIPTEGVSAAASATAVASGGEHTCAVTSEGGVKGFGGNTYGELGDGTGTDHLTAVDVSGLGSGVAAIATGAYHTCAVTNQGGVKCWGYNLVGQLGDGSNDQRFTPVGVVGLRGIGIVNLPVIKK
jgi:alpha-tubulin suppressor-like RCC1 family protein